MVLMGDHKVYRRQEDVLFAPAGEMFLLMSVAHGRYFSFNESAARIWELLAEPVSLASICAALIAEYDVDPETCRHDSAVFMDALTTAGLVTEAEASAA